MALSSLTPSKAALVAIAVLCTLLTRLPCRAAQSSDPIDTLERDSIALVFIDNSEFGVGFVVASDARSSYLLTAAHVLGCADTDKVGCRDTVKVRFVGQLASLTGSKVLAWKDIKDGTDLALVKVDRGNLTPVPVLSQTQTDEEFYVIGFSQRIIESTDQFGGRPEVHDGNVSRINSPEAQNFLEVSVPAYPGFSGGPIVDKTTHAVVGVFSGHLRAEDQTQIDYQGVGPAVILKFLAAAESLTHVPIAQTSAESAAQIKDSSADLGPLEAPRPNAPISGSSGAASPVLHTSAAALSFPSPATAYREAIASIRGDGVEPDPKAGVALLTSAADAKYSPALTALAGVYASGSIVVADPARALELYRAGAELGDPSADLALGRISHYGKLGTVANETQSKAWYAKAIAGFTTASNGGDADATWALAHAYFNGNGVTRDPAKSIALLQTASNQGSAGATTNLGISYLNGRTVDLDIAKGISLLTKAETLGDPRAALHLSNIYRKGQFGIARDPIKAAHLREEAATGGVASAMWALGFDALGGSNGVPKDLIKAGLWFRRSAAVGYLPGETQYGRWLIETGPPASRDPARGVALLEDCAGKGWHSAQLILGEYFREGRYLPRDDVKAFAYLQKSAQGSNVNAEYDLGQAYESGQGIAVNPEQAKYWFLLAANQGYEPARRKLGIAAK